MSQQNIAFYELFNPTLQALHQLGGSGTNQEIHDKVVVIMDLSDDEIAKLHKPGQSNLTRIAYRLSWVRTNLKRYGLIENSSRGVWSLTPNVKETTEVDGREVQSAVNEMNRQERPELSGNETTDSADEDEELTQVDADESDQTWRDSLFTVLKEMDATGFERLCKRILRESGFTKVENTQASHDGGVDGWGILQVNEFLSFRVVFQCKRYDGSVGPDVVQKLRGAMPGNADRGLIMTTGHFTNGAQKEAAHEHKAPIELVDGEQLIDKLKELSLGVAKEEVIVERVTINSDFFANI